MKTYTHASLNEGSGVFDHLMRTSRALPGWGDEMPPEVAVGFVAAAIKSGLTHSQMNNVIEHSFDAQTASLLRTVRETYDGDDQRVHLWEWESDDLYRLHPNLKYLVRPRWRFDQRELARI